MKEPSYASSDKRIIWLDLVKFIAIFMMIAVHCTDNVSPAERSEPWYNLWGSFYGSFMRPAIPLFVMVTGALLLPVFITGYCITFLGFKSVTAVPGQPVELVELFFTYCSPNVLMMTLPLFLAMQKVKIRSERTRRFAVNISTCTLGIWMSHYLFLGPCYMLVESLPIHTMLKMIVCTILLLSVTWIFVYAVRKSGNIGRWIMG